MCPGDCKSLASALGVRFPPHARNCYLQDWNIMEPYRFFAVAGIAGGVTLLANTSFNQNWHFLIVWLIALVVVYGGILIFDGDMNPFD